jgi:hypothetical protein
MKRLVPAVLLVFALAVAGAAAWLYLNGGYSRAGSQPIIDERPLAAFTKVEFAGFAEVTLVQGGAPGIRIEASRRQLAAVRAEVTDGALKVAVDEKRRWWRQLLGGTQRPVQITVTFTDLAEIRSAGAIRIRAERLHVKRLEVAMSGAATIRIDDLRAADLDLAGSGAMKADLAGDVGRQSVAISGAGQYMAPNLVSQTAAVAVHGAGRVVVRAERELDVAISGAGSVEYLGNPRVQQQVKGAGRVKKRAEGPEPGVRVARAA